MTNRPLLCISGDSFWLALAESGIVYSWGDSDYGKCGRGQESSKTPRIVEKLQGLQVDRIFCGPQFSLALCRNGALYTWGKGDNYRLGFPSEDHVR